MGGRRMEVMKPGRPQGSPLQMGSEMMVNILNLVSVNLTLSPFFRCGLRGSNIKPILLDSTGIDLLVQIETKAGRVGDANQPIRD